MNLKVAGDGARSNSSEAESRRESFRGDERGNIPPGVCSFAVAVRRVWHVKAPAAIAAHTGRSEQTCRDWTSARSEAPASVVIALLRSPEGFLVLKAFMEYAPPDWWLVIKRERELAALATEIFQRIGAVVKP